MVTLASRIVLLSGFLLCGLGFVHAVTIGNPTKFPYEQALIRLNPGGSEVSGRPRVTRDGVDKVFQLERLPDGRALIWVAVDLEPGAKAEYLVGPGGGPEPRYRPLAREEGNDLLLDNGLVQFRLPGAWSPGEPLPAPIRGLRLADGLWRGQGEWVSAPEPTGFSAEVLGRGPLFAKARLRYEFGSQWAEVEVTLPPGRSFAVVESRHAMREGDGWMFDFAAGWTPGHGSLRRWYNAAFSGAPALETFPLKPGYTRTGDTVIELIPRWTQAYDDGWSFGVVNAEVYAGALVVRAGEWTWPHDNALHVKVREQGDRGAVFLPTHRGGRKWLLLAGEAGLEAEAPSIARRESVLNPDKLTHAYRLPFDEGETKLIGGEDFYSNQTNPTGMMRQQNKRRLSSAAGGSTNNSLGTLYQAQAFFDPDWYGDLEDHWSPINPNFHTDFIKGGIALAAQLRNHPAFPHVRALAEKAFRNDVDFAVTLPGGAGQECPGYQHHAMEAWRDMAPVCANFLGFDPREWPRYREGARFLAEISVPDGNGGRTFHPAGDTHPNRPEPIGLAREFGANVNPRELKSAEYPGFGAVLRNHSGTAGETFLSFKSGPNRGHYHGDQLSIHWCVEAKPLAVDHHASYKPRPGQEHMHNRLSFSVNGMPYANMDGHERLIAFSTGERADVAVGQVESRRLREVKALPPEDWDVSFPQHRFDEPLVYRRTVILLKGTPDVVVLVDEFTGPDVMATWNLHVLGDRAERRGDWIDFGNARVFLAAEPGETYEALPWEHDNGGREKTTAARVSRKGRSGRFLSVLVPGDRPLEVKHVADNQWNLQGFGVLTMRENGGITLGTPGGGEEWLLRPEDIDLDRSQGEVGLFVPDVGYPFGPLPEWLIEQRTEQ